MKASRLRIPVGAWSGSHCCGCCSVAACVCLSFDALGFDTFVPFRSHTAISNDFQEGAGWSGVQSERYVRSERSLPPASAGSICVPLTTSCEPTQIASQVAGHACLLFVPFLISADYVAGLCRVMCELAHVQMPRLWGCLCYGLSSCRTSVRVNLCRAHAPR